MGFTSDLIAPSAKHAEGHEREAGVFPIIIITADKRPAATGGAGRKAFSVDDQDRRLSERTQIECGAHSENTGSDDHYVRKHFSSSPYKRVLDDREREHPHESPNLTKRRSPALESRGDAAHLAARIPCEASARLGRATSATASRTASSANFISSWEIISGGSSLSTWSWTPHLSTITPPSNSRRWMARVSAGSRNSRPVSNPRPFTRAVPAGKLIAMSDKLSRMSWARSWTVSASALSDQ